MQNISDETIMTDILDTLDSYNLVLFYSEPNYKNMLFKELCMIFENIIIHEEETCDMDTICSDYTSENILTQTEHLILNIIDFYDEYISVPRSIKDTQTDYSIVSKEKINLIRSYYQPLQKSEEWYKYRNQLITASSAWKLLHTVATKNEYIYNKCKPFDVTKYNTVNINSPFHWGNKYEDVSVSLYEYLYNVTVEDFGCIKHPKYDYIGASPDGIIVSENRRGRMLEIKNIVNRDITGIPKKEYWIQTQLQMETCDLDDCDFLECRFKEYENEEAFRKDGTFIHTADGHYKGVIVQFFDGFKPIYEYAPFLCEESVFNLWNSSILGKNKEFTWIKNIYWFLPEYSCVHIKRNKLWFESIRPILADSWKIIQKEKKEGYEHRKPTSRTRVKKTNTSENVLFSIDTIKQL